MRAAISLSVGLAVVSVAGLASAQDLSTPQVSTAQVAPAGNSGGGGEITSTRGETDHSMVVGHLGLRYFGSESIQTLGAATGGGMPPGTSSRTLQTVGARYWLNNNLGLDVGISLGLAGGSHSQTSTSAAGTMTTSNDDPSFFGFGLYGAVPIMLAEAKHLAIHIDPFLRLAYGHSGITTGSGGSQVDFSSSAFNFSVGGNVVAELQFGFIGLPQLGLQAQFGVSVVYQTTGTTTTPNMGSGSSTTNSGYSIGTSLGSFALADIISGSLSAVWYFGYTPGSAR